MHVRLTYHEQFLRERCHESPAGRVLNVKYLTQALERNIGHLIGRSSAKGKKRAAPREIEGRARRKRFKPVEPGDTHHLDDDDEESASISVAAYQHTLELQYTRCGFNNVVPDAEAAAIGWRKEEEELCGLLEKVMASQVTNGPYITELGEVELSLEGTKIDVTLGGSYLLTVPRVDPDFQPLKHDIRSAQARDPLTACTVLQEAGRAEVVTRARVETQPANSTNGNLPFRILLEVTVSLVKPAIFAPIIYKTKTAVSQVEDAQRRALCYMFSTPDSVPQARHVDIPSLYSAIGPAPHVQAPLTEDSFQPPSLLPTLLPFQRRSVAWMLSREGKYLDRDGRAVSCELSNDRELPLYWQAVKVNDSETWYLNCVTGMLSPVIPEHADPAGGILAEEPGLGKTLECIALILLNPAIGRNPTHKTWNTETRIFVKEIKTTLIVTPPSLAQQWMDEIKAHAPSLKVLVYDGWSKLSVPITESDLAALRAARTKNPKTKKSATQAGSAAHKENAEDTQDKLMDWCNYVNTFDVCITTYPVLQQDLGIARPPPDRPRRSIATYINVERPRSPLVMCEWYRVIMDEVQMVGGGNTEEMVSLIPRLSSFAVSGTPARSKIADLIHVLNFLRLDSVVNTPRVWQRLLMPGYAAQFVELFHRFAIRTMKASVKDELTIPKQTRYLVPIELGRVERHVYDHNFENALLELGMDARGVAIAENWQVDTGALRYWLRKLRGICTHPQVGQLQNQDKLHKPGVLKTMADVLEGMKEQNWRNMMDDRRQKVHLQSVIAQLHQHAKSNLGYLQSALDVILKAENEATKLIKDIQIAIDEHTAAGQKLMNDAANQRDPTNHPEESIASSSKGKGKARESTHDTASLDGDDDGLPKTAAAEEHRIKRRALQQRLRECQITLHRVYFLKGDIYHSLGESYSDEESAAYSAAEDLRRILLRSTEHAAKRAMKHLVQEADEKGITQAELFINVPYLEKGGIRSVELMEEANEMIDDLLNEQGALLWKWRDHLIGLLTQPLTSDEGEDADGQEYARSLDTQGEAEAYLQAYSALLADRREALTSERTLLAALDVKEKKSRKTKSAKKAAAASMAVQDEDIIMTLGDIDPQPEHEVLMKDLHEARKELLENFNSERAMRSIMIDLNNVAVRIIREKDPEKPIVTEAVKRLRALVADQAKLSEKLHADLTRLRKAFNERISYFRQLQEISDTVAEIEWEGSAEQSLKKNEADHTELEVRVNTARARQRYLEHLARAQGEGTLDEEEEACILCRCEFTRGYITQCAHVFCEACMKIWLARKEGKACPVCRVAINSDQLQRFVVDQKPEEPAPVRLTNNESVPRSHRQIMYNFISSAVMDDIQTMESHGSYGSKIQTLVRHLLYIQVIEPGAKSIVFSAWADSLQIIEHALSSNNIPCLRIDQKRGKDSAAKRFKADPSLQVLLLHGDHENAGLNVTCASRVFLVESVVHHAFEIQAIARIDRMGQTRPTEVFCYYAEETVERNILDLAARQGASLYTKENAAGTLTAGPITSPTKDAVDAPNKRATKGDFVFKTDDMLAIFFPHLFEELEYLLPRDITDPQPANEGQGADEILANAVAGPSRLS